MIRTVVYSAGVLLLLTIVVTDGFPVLSMIQANGDLMQRQKRTLPDLGGSLSSLSGLGSLGSSPLSQHTSSVDGAVRGAGAKTGTVADGTKAGTGLIISAVEKEHEQLQTQVQGVLNAGSELQTMGAARGTDLQKVFVAEGQQAEQTMGDTKAAVQKKLEGSSALGLKPDETVGVDRMEPLPVSKDVESAVHVVPHVDEPAKESEVAEETPEPEEPEEEEPAEEED